MPVASDFLSIRNLLLFDAVTCAGMGALLALGSEPVGLFTLIPDMLLFYAGVGLFPVAGVMALVALLPAISSAGVRLVVLGNILWVAASALLLLTGWILPNAWGVTFIVTQALVVALLAGLEHRALREAASGSGAI